MTVPHLRTVPEYLDYWAEHTPDAPAMTHDGVTTGYADLKHQVDDAARALLAAGIRKGDRIAVLTHPSPHFWLTFLASLSIGGVWLGLNPKYKLPELEYNVGNSRPSLLLGIGEYGDDDFTPTLETLAASVSAPPPVIFDGGSSTPELETWSDFLARGRHITDAQLDDARAKVDEHSPALIVYTSGSTGRPKGAVLGHGGIARSFEIQAHRSPVDKIRGIANLPINHIGGVGDLCCTPLVQGGSIVFQEQFDPRAVIDAVENHAVNSLMQIPTTLKILAEHPDFATADLSGLRYVSWGGGPLPLHVVRRFRNLGVRMSTTFGMTEITGSVSYSTDDASDEQLANTVGKPIDEIDFRLVDETGREIPHGAHGEIQVRHPGLLLEYFDNPQATQDAFTDDGYFSTGDVGYIRDDGNLCLVARTKEVFKSGGYNTYPREIELVLEDHPAVRLASVVPASHPVFDEVGVAYVEVSDPTISEDVLRAWCHERLANYKVPKRVIQLDQLPLLPVGKVDKMTLRNKAAEHVAPQFAAVR